MFKIFQMLKFSKAVAYSKWMVNTAGIENKSMSFTDAVLESFKEASDY